MFGFALAEHHQLQQPLGVKSVWEADTESLITDVNLHELYIYIEL